jgi:hypothetical protein
VSDFVSTARDDVSSEDSSAARAETSGETISVDDPQPSANNKQTQIHLVTITLLLCLD